ncbi:hypothetical protein LguiA_002134 [Lonicera macranthoides]
MCGSAHDTALDNLKSALDAVQKFFPIDPTKGDIANNTLTYVELGINVAFQTLRNYSVRLSDAMVRFQLELGYEGEFSDLEDTQKLEVYKKIIKESGQEDIFQMEMDITDVGGIAVFLLTASDSPAATPPTRCRRTLSDAAGGKHLEYSSEHSLGDASERFSRKEEISCKAARGVPSCPAAAAAAALAGGPDLAGAPGLASVAPGLAVGGPDLRTTSLSAGVASPAAYTAADASSSNKRRGVVLGKKTTAITKEKGRTPVTYEDSIRGTPFSVNYDIDHRRRELAGWIKKKTANRFRDPEFQRRIEQMKAYMKKGEQAPHAKTYIDMYKKFDPDGTSRVQQASDEAVASLMASMPPIKDTSDGSLLASVTAPPRLSVNVEIGGIERVVGPSRGTRVPGLGSGVNKQPRTRGPSQLEPRNVAIEEEFARLRENQKELEECLQQERRDRQERERQLEREMQERETQLERERKDRDRERLEFEVRV